MPAGPHMFARPARRRSRAALLIVPLTVLLVMSASVFALSLAGASFGSADPATAGATVLSAADSRAMESAAASLATGARPADGTSASCAAASGPAELTCSSGDAPASSPPSLAAPIHRWGAEITYDAADGYPLLFGGQNDTWAFEDGNWVQLHPKVIPPIVSFACLTYDWKDGYVLLYGGGRGGIGTPDIDRDLTWTFRGGVWTNITNPQDSPPGLQYPSCTYDAAPGDDYVVLFGGVYGEGPSQTGQSYLTLHSTNQTWEFTGGRWTNLTDYSAPHPSARFGASMVYDSSAGYVLLYGGAVNGTSTANGSCTPVECPHLNDTWTFHAGAWTNITATASTHGTPPGRWEAGIANDSADGYVIIFGGQANGYKSYNATQNFTWGFVDGAWSNLTPTLSVSPQPRFGEAMGYDPGTGSVLMFSGLNSTRAAVLWENSWAFYANGWHPLTYFLNFTESGLPAGQSWNVTVTPSQGPAATLGNTTPTISFGWATGNYSYAIASVANFHITAGTSSGPVRVSDPTITVGWSPDKYTVRFTEKGLKSAWKTEWSVTLNGVAKRSTGGSLAFGGLAPGTYAYTIGSVTNYSLNRSYSGSVEVLATGESEVAASVALRWTLVTYRVAFDEKGLPAGTPWSVTLDGVTKSGTGSKIMFSVSNGTYAYSVTAEDYEPAPSSGTVNVAGAATTIHVTFAANAPADGRPTGLAASARPET